jgi:hypothetical protein
MVANSSTGSNRITMPTTSHLILPGAVILSPCSIPLEWFNLTSEEKREPPLDSQQPTLVETQVAIYEAEANIGPLGSGCLPLSVKLATYGESLALKRGLKVGQKMVICRCLRTAHWPLAHFHSHT